MKEPKMTILKLTANEAVVSVNFFVRFRDQEKLKIQDPAKEQLLWDLCVILNQKFLDH